MSVMARWMLKKWGRFKRRDILMLCCLGLILVANLIAAISDFSVGISWVRMVITGIALVGLWIVSDFYKKKYTSMGE